MISTSNEPQPLTANDSPDSASSQEVAAPASSGSTEVAAYSGPESGNAFNLLRDVTVEITLEIGRRKLRIADVLKLTTGQTLELSKAAGEPLDIYVNGQFLGRGEAVVLGDRYGVRITEITTVSNGTHS